MRWRNQEVPLLSREESGAVNTQAMTLPQGGNKTTPLVVE
jgi:hypothetical protein